MLLAMIVSIASAAANSSAPPVQDPMTVRISPHYRGSFLVNSKQTFACPGFRIVVETEHGLREGRHYGRFLAVSVNGQNVRAVTLEHLNDRMSRFAWTPQLYPECSRSGVRLKLQREEPGRPLDDEVVDLQ
jgi:hypothetical protein